VAPYNPHNLAWPGRYLKLSFPSTMNLIFPQTWFLFEAPGLLPRCWHPFSVTFGPSISRKERRAVFLVDSSILHGTAKIKNKNQNCTPAYERPSHGKMI